MPKELGNLHLKVGDAHVTIQTGNFTEYHDGFSFTVASQLEAFQAAYLYQGCKRVNVRPATSGLWLVQVYR